MTTPTDSPLRTAARNLLAAYPTGCDGLGCGGWDDLAAPLRAALDQETATELAPAADQEKHHRALSRAIADALACPPATADHLAAVLDHDPAVRAAMRPGAPTLMARRDALAKGIADANACGHCEGTCRACREEADHLLATGAVTDADAVAETAERLVSLAGATVRSAYLERPDDLADALTSTARQIKNHADTLRRLTTTEENRHA